ncbi:S-layer homology domain-containing protein [Paenibacillus xylanilyticus]|uniref:S-layer homology domain-containing protein n=1 Tax=Paenibacillus xylanilyticus TaxID=248903 RepID=UPI00129D4807|nr:S-layer homology domain-containing protein [Paenibacillus xylanilyticus]
MMDNYRFAQKILFCLLSLLLIINEPAYVGAQIATKDIFNDIRYSYANYEINELARNKIIEGYKDGTFRPNQFINREEFATMVGRVLKLPVPTSNQWVPARVSSWAEPWIVAVMEAQIPNVLPNRHWFGAKNRVTKEEAIMWYVRGLGVGVKLEKMDNLPDFNDVDQISDEARNSVWLAQRLGIIQGNANGDLKPQSILDRQGAAAISYRVFRNAAKYKERALKLLEMVDSKEGSDSENPVDPGPTPPNPVDPGPTPSNPVDPGPTPPDPVDPGPTPPDPVDPGPTLPDPIDPGPTLPDPVDPGPTLPDPVDPGPTPPDPVDPVVDPITVSLATYTIPATHEAYGSNWKMVYTFIDVQGQEIPSNRLPADLQVTFSDDLQILGSDGDISNFYNIPPSGSSVEGQISVVSLQNGIDFNQSFSLTVEPSSIGQQYFGVSILLEDTGAQATTIAEMDEIRSMLSTIDPSLKVTWALDNRFVFNESQRPQLKRLLEYIDAYGDEVGIAAGYPNNNYSLSEWASEMNSWMYMYRYNALTNLHEGGTNGQSSVWNSIPEAYRPKSLSTYAVNPEQAMWLKQNFNIDSFMGWAATQYNVDQLSAEGSPLMPYWSNINNPMVPAQSSGDNSGLIFMNAITIDPIGSRYITGSSRWTIHPADPYVDEMSAFPQLRTTANYINNPYRNLNTQNYLSLVVGANWIMRTPNLKSNFSAYVNQFPAGAKTNIVGVHQLSETFKQRSGGSNDNTSFTLMFRGTGYTTSLGSYVSPENLRYLWMETKTERIILAKEDQETEWNVIDFTDYSRTPIPILPYTKHGAAEDISYVTGRNYKLAPDAPLAQSEVDRVKQRLQSILFNESVRIP